MTKRDHWILVVHWKTNFHVKKRPILLICFRYGWLTKWFGNFADSFLPRNDLGKSQLPTQVEQPSINVSNDRSHTDWIWALFFCRRTMQSQTLKEQKKWQRNPVHFEDRSNFVQKTKRNSYDQEKQQVQLVYEEYPTRLSRRANIRCWYVRWREFRVNLQRLRINHIEWMRKRRKQKAAEWLFLLFICFESHV